MNPTPDRPWTTWGLPAAAALATLFFGVGYVRARALAALEPGGHWAAIAWVLFGLGAVALVLLALQFRTRKQSVLFGLAAAAGGVTLLVLREVGPGTLVLLVGCLGLGWSIGGYGGGGYGASDS